MISDFWTQAVRLLLQKECNPIYTDHNHCIYSMLYNIHSRHGKIPPCHLEQWFPTTGPRTWHWAAEPTKLQEGECLHVRPCSPPLCTSFLCTTRPVTVAFMIETTGGGGGVHVRTYASLKTAPRPLTGPQAPRKNTSGGWRGKSWGPLI